MNEEEKEKILGIIDAYVRAFEMADADLMQTCLGLMILALLKWRTIFLSLFVVRGFFG